MRAFYFCLTALLATSVAQVASAEDTYTIKFKTDADIGKVVTIKNVEKAQGFIKVYDGEDQVKTDEKPEGKDEEHRDVVLERDKNGKDIKFLRTYVKARKGTGAKERTLSYEGATLLFEKRTAGWQLSVAGTAKLTPKDADDLVKKLNEKDQDPQIDENLAPKKPVKIGEEWTLDNKATLGTMKTLTANLEKSALKAKLTKVFMQGKSQMGVLEVDFKIVIDKAFGAVTFATPGVLHMKGTLTVAIDGSTTETTRSTKNTFDADGKINGPAGQQGRMVFKVDSDETLTVTAEKDDADARKIPKVTAIAGAEVWLDFTSKEHEFKATFPGKPQTQTRKDKNGNTTTQYLVGVGDDLGYIVAITDFPKEIPLDAETILAALEGNANVKEKSKIKMNGFPGREFILDVGTKAKPMKGIQRVWLVNNRMYQALYIEAEGAKGGDAKKFLDSFRFDAKQKGKDD